MGFTPAQCNAMTLWEFNACVEGYLAAHESSDAGASTPSAEDIRAFMALPSVGAGPPPPPAASEPHGN